MYGNLHFVVLHIMIGFFLRIGSTKNRIGAFKFVYDQK